MVETTKFVDSDDNTTTVASVPLATVVVPYGSTEEDTTIAVITVSEDEPSIPVWQIAAILSTAFTYGCIFTTLFLIVLPVECTRIQQEFHHVQKSVSLGAFVAIAGCAQLISPLVGMMSDTFYPPRRNLGQRLPYFLFGSILTIGGVLGQYYCSVHSRWTWYSISLAIHMIGINIIYSMMIALIPDQVPSHQTGTANGTLAFLLVTGSLFGFAFFHTALRTSVTAMYPLYAAVAVVGMVLTFVFGNTRDVRLAWERMGSHNVNESSKGWLLCDLARSMIVEPLHDLDWEKLRKSYTIDTTKYHDFFIVTVSRTFYYMGLSVQAFFLYFLHDIVHQHHPQRTVASLAILGQIAGALTCYPTGILSDRCGRQRKPFVYMACFILAAATFSLLFCRHVRQVVILGILFGGANGIYLTMDTSLAVDTLPKEHDADGSGNAQLLGVWGVAGFVGSALGPMIGGPLLYLFGHKNGHNHNGGQSYSIEGYSVVVTLAAVYFIFSALTLKLYLRNRNV